ncbi:MAG: phosphatase PAP2 family protein [Patescibacteria group bacterium]|nr:phosphatase PAP2 family protein [Patescibacteria group bacterium]
MNLMNLIYIFSAKYLYLIGLIIAIIWFWKLPKEKKRMAILFGAIALPTIYIISKISSLLYFDPRPFVSGHFTPLIPHAPDNGFPSDHALLVSAIASIIFPFNKKISIFVWLIAILVGTARVFAGIHHPIDIVGSILISAATSSIIYPILYGKRK